MQALEPESGLLLVVDLQEKLLGAMPSDAAARLIKNTLALLEAARILRIAVLATEQYPKGLGRTVHPIAEALTSRQAAPIDKLVFDACSEPRFDAVLTKLAPRSVVIAGVETHICVFQTGRELVNRGLDVRIAGDAVASRDELNRDRGLALCERAGAIVMPMESVVYDWVRRAGSDEFKAISKLLR
jgi:nicotinamidase-related amidase